MHRVLKALAASVLAATVLLATREAPAGKGFVASKALRPLPGSIEPLAAGGVTTWLKVRGDGSIVQHFSAWIKGLDDAEGATLWMALPGDLETEEVGVFATTDNGSGVFVLHDDTNRADGQDMPLGVDRVLDLLRAPVEVRVPGFEEDDEIVLRGTISEFRYKSIPGGGRRAVRSRRTRMLLPPTPLPLPDPDARGKVRLFKRKRADVFGDRPQGIHVVVSGLLADDDYEVWIEDASGEMQEVGEMITTEDGTGYYSLDTEAGDTLPFEADIEDVSDLHGRRLEIRYFGEDDYSLVALCPRMR